MWILVPLFLLSIGLLLISLQFNEPTASAYKDMIFLTFAFYAIALGKGFAGWLGLGEKNKLTLGVLYGIGLFAITSVLGVVVNAPQAIGTSQVLNIFYRFFSAVFIETGLFFAIIYPTFKKLFKGNAFSASTLTTLAWSGFHIVALQGIPSDFIKLVVTGFLYCMANERVGSVVPCLTAHGIDNFIKVVIKGV